MVGRKDGSTGRRALKNLLHSVVFMTDLLEALDKDGRNASPILSEECKNFMIDIDGTICDDVPNEEPERMVDVEVYEGAVETINKWFDEGHIITFFTSRTEAHREVTETWLTKHGFRYHGILFGKPRGGNYHWIDNHTVRATKFHDNFTDLVKKVKQIEVFPDEPEV